ncbi:MAG: formate/nitrite transporter family protein, partial [Thermoanaerobaculia bacterium]
MTVNSDVADPKTRQEHSAEKEKGEEPQKGYETILEQEIVSGQKELERPAGNLFLSGLSAGLDLSLSLLLMGVMRNLTEGTLPHPVSEILVANMYAAGFLFVVLGRSELFTEHTTLAVLPVLDGRASVAQLGRLWGLVYIANLLGAAAFAGFLSFLGPQLGVVPSHVLGSIASDV